MPALFVAASRLQGKECAQAHLLCLAEVQFQVFMTPKRVVFFCDNSMRDEGCSRLLKYYWQDSAVSQIDKNDFVSTKAMRVQEIILME